MWGAVLWIGAAAGCGCPPAPCTSWARVEVRVDTWRAGTYDLSVQGDGLSLACTLDVLADGAPPTDFDVACNDRVDRMAYLQDTGLIGVAEAVLLKVPVPLEGPPDTVAVQVRHTAPQAGAEPTVLIEEAARPLSWVPRRPLAGSCAEDCVLAEIDLVVPDAASAGGTEGDGG